MRRRRLSAPLPGGFTSGLSGWFVQGRLIGGSARACECVGGIVIAGRERGGGVGGGEITDFRNAPTS